MKIFFNNAQRLVLYWLYHEGFSVGIKDCIIDKHVIDNLDQLNQQKQMEINKLITEVENNPELLDLITLEKYIQNSLETFGNNMSKDVFQNIEDKGDNGFYILIKSNTKGSQQNFNQLSGIFGQSTLESKRIQKKVNNRTSVHFFQNDDRALARGFITNPLFKELGSISNSGGR